MLGSAVATTENDISDDYANCDGDFDDYADCAFFL